MEIEDDSEFDSDIDDEGDVDSESETPRDQDGDDHAEVTLKPGETFSQEEHRKNIRHSSITECLFFRKYNFSINYEVFPDLIPYFWASMHQYAQELMELFIISDGWRMVDFLKAAETRKLNSVFRCMYTNRGTIEQRAKHFEIAFQIFLEAAKFQWLGPWKKKNGFGLGVCIKRQIGGCYMCFYLLSQQPTPPAGVLSTAKQKLHVDPDDSTAIRFFIKDVEKLNDSGDGKELKSEVKLAFLKMHRGEYIEKTLFKDDYSLDTPSLFLATAKSDPRLNYFGQLKDVRDKLLYFTYQGIGNTTFREMLKVAQRILDSDKIKKRKPVTSHEHGSDKTPKKSSSQTTSEGPLTFQTRLRQRLDIAFQTFQQKHLSPEIGSESSSNASNLTSPKSKSKCSSASSSPIKKPQSSTSSFPNKTRATTANKNIKNDNSFPPVRRTEWTTEAINGLKGERDLAVIAFRIVEILRFVTPENPLTPSRLINDIWVERTANNLIAEYDKRGKSSHGARLKCPSRLAKLSQKEKHHCLATPETKCWLDYFNDSRKKILNPTEMLQKMRTHEVVATEPVLVFKPLEHPDSIFVDGDEEFAFEDTQLVEGWVVDRNGKWIQESPAPDTTCTSESSSFLQPVQEGINEYCDMPDLNKFCDLDVGTPTSFCDEPPLLSPITQLQKTDLMQATPIDLVNPTTPDDGDTNSDPLAEEVLPFSSGVSSRPWFILSTDERLNNFPPSPKPFEQLETNDSINPNVLSMPSLSGLSISPSSNRQPPPSELVQSDSYYDGSTSPIKARSKAKKIPTPTRQSIPRNKKKVRS